MRSIFLVEDHAIYASVLIRLFQESGDLEVTGIARTGEEALERLPEGVFDLVLVDVFLPRMSGITLVGLIRNRYPHLPCMMLSGHMLGHYVRSSLRAGARGYVLKDNSPEILEGVRHVLRGETYVSEELRHT